MASNRSNKTIGSSLIVVDWQSWLFLQTSDTALAIALLYGTCDSTAYYATVCVCVHYCGHVLLAIP
jgi:hypothetical protein